MNSPQDMNAPQDSFATIHCGERALLENTNNEQISLSVLMSDGARLDLDLLPRQVIEVTSGKHDSRIVVHSGDPSGLLVIKPESAS